ncbi:MAG: TetR/AcrR family transcriptional regulator [Daejeonella sp.]
MEFAKAQEVINKRVKDKDQTKRKLLWAVGEIIRTKGYRGLGTNKIAKLAGYDKQLIYRYFGNADRLIEAYVLEKDYWMVFSNKLNTSLNIQNVNLQEMVSSILENQFTFFLEEMEMQQIIIWELTGESDLMRSISNLRESQAEPLLELTDEYFKNSKINFRVLSALISAGIYYMVLHSNLDEFCGIDIRKAGDQEKVREGIREIINLAFNHAGQTN